MNDADGKGEAKKVHCIIRHARALKSHAKGEMVGELNSLMPRACYLC